MQLGDCSIQIGKGDLSLLSAQFFGESYWMLQDIAMHSEERNRKIKHLFVSILLASGGVALGGGGLGYYLGFKTIVGVSASIVGTLSGAISLISAVTGFCVYKNREEIGEEAKVFLNGTHVGAEFLLALQVFKEAKEESKLVLMVQKFEAILACKECFQILRGDVTLCGIHLMTFDPALSEKEFEVLSGVGKLWLVSEAIDLLKTLTHDAIIVREWKKALRGEKRQMFWISRGLKPPTDDEYKAFNDQKIKKQYVDVKERIIEIFKTVVQELED